MTKIRVLFDESMPRKFSHYLPDRFEVRTTQKMEWSGTENGELLKIAAEAGFTALITTDKNIAKQQNPDKLPMTVIVLDTHPSRIDYLEPMLPTVISVLEDNPDKELIRIESLEEGDKIQVTKRTATAPSSDRKPF